jgi:hypothetical protein
MQAAEDGVAVADRRAGQGQVGQTAQQRGDGEPCFQAGERRAGAEG